MKEFKNKMLDLIGKQETNADEYMLQLMRAEQYVNDALKTYPDALQDKYPLFALSTDDRLKEAKIMLEQTRENPLNGFVQLLRKKIRSFSHWVSDNNYGYVMNAVVDNSGDCVFTVQAEIHATETETIQDIAKAKEAEGYDLVSLENNPDFVEYKASDNNKKLLRKALEKYNASMFSFKSWDLGDLTEAILFNYEFRISLASLDAVQNEKPDEFYSGDENCLESKNFDLLKSDIEDFMLAFSLYENKKTAYMARNMYTMFVMLCNHLGVETELSKKLNDSYAEERKKNIEIYHLNAEIAKAASMDGARDMIRKKYKTLRCVFQSREPMYISEFAMNEYGNVELTLRRSSFPAKIKKEDWLFSDDDVNGFMLKDCDQNLHKIEEMLPGGTISEVVSEFRGGIRGIKSIKMNIDFKNL